MDNLRFAWEGVMAHRLRSAMTALGVVIGVASVIAVAAVVEGLSRQITQNVDNLGTNSLTVRAYTPVEQQLRGVQNHLDIRDYQRAKLAVGRQGEATPTFAPFGVFGTTVKSNRLTAATRVLGVTPGYQDANRSYTSAGRFLTPGDLSSRRSVCVVGATLVEHLRLGPNPIGQYLLIGDQWFKIVGLMAEKGDVFGISQDDYVLIPFSVGESLGGNGAQQDITININVAQGADIDIVAQQVRTALRRLHPLGAKETEPFKVQTAKQLRATVVNITSAVALALVGIVAISVLVSGIGIMNIMLVSVTERTKEIGICKAIGAQRNDILIQFLAEAVIISSLGGAAGFCLGALTAFIVSFLIPYVSVFHIPGWAIGLSVLFSTGTGIVFGVLPAAKAAKLNPIDALRFE